MYVPFSVDKRRIRWFPFNVSIQYTSFNLCKFKSVWCTENHLLTNDRKYGGPFVVRRVYSNPENLMGCKLNAVSVKLFACI